MKWFVIGAALLVGVFLFGCVNSETGQVANSGVVQATPIPLSNSIEQANINAKLAIMNKATTVMWFYGLSETGQVIFRSQVKGKVTSSYKRLEPKKIGCNDNSQYCWESIQADGTFGESDEYVFWFDFEGNYYQWNGKYILTTKPLHIPTPAMEFQEAK
jgi:hypothetical protein